MCGDRALEDLRPLLEVLVGERAQDEAALRRDDLEGELVLVGR
jgi:hypothetical protein